MKSRKKQRRIWPKVLILVLFLLAAGGVSLGVCWANGIFGAKRQEVPEMRVWLADVPLEEINAGEKSTKYGGNQMSLTADGETMKFNDVEIKGRGNSTWGRLKKPYQIKIPQRESLLGMGRARKWILLANSLDRSYLRNDIAFWLMRLMGQKYVMGGEFVELYVDDIYYGLYYLTNKVNIGKEEVDLRDPMGILVEMDNLHSTEIGECEAFSKVNNSCMTTQDVVAEDNAAGALAMFMTDFDALERAAEQGDWAKAQELIDPETFAEYFLLSEFTVNPDAYGSSFFMYKDGVEDVIHAGPAWDYDFALSNRLWAGWWGELHSPQGDLVTKIRADGGWTIDAEGNIFYNEVDESVSHLFFDLLEIPEFRELTKRIWRERMAGHVDELISYIDEQVDYIRPAAERDQVRWKLDTFDEEVEYLKNWIWQRYEFFDATYGAIEPERLPDTVMNDFSTNL